MASERELKLWWHAPVGDAHNDILRYVQGVEQRQSRVFDKFIKLDGMYDPNSVRAELYGVRGGDSLGLVTENVVASNVDTVTAAIAATDIRARFMTDDGDWTTQRTARHLEWYAEALSKQLELDTKCQRAFKSAAIKGTGIVYVYSDGAKQVRADHVPVDEIVVDEAESHGATPRQIHRRYFCDRDELKMRYPGHEEAIENAQYGARGLWQMWLSYRPSETNEILVVHSWLLPVGVKGKPGYRAGREVVSIDNATIHDEKYHKPFFPLARFVWSEPEQGWYGIGGAERIAGHQRALNRRNWQIDRLLQQNAVPTTYVRRADANLRAQTTNELGTIALYNADIPVTVHQPIVNKETYASRDQLKASAFQEFGVSMLAAHATKPAGIDSGVALREYRDQTTQRFSMQEKGFEKLKLDATWLVVDVCKDLGKAAPTMMRRSRFGKRVIPWSKVDMGDVKVQIAAASTLSRTPAGRMQTVLEWAQAGVVSMDEARRLMRHPDLERAMSVYTAALEAIEHALEEIEDGATLVPEPFDNLKMIVWRGQMEYLKIRDDGAPEEVLESLRQYVVQAAWIIGQQTAANGNAAAADDGMAGAAAAMPGAGAAGDQPPMPGAPPANDAAAAAFAPQAMQLRAV
ncbi:MAG TPA: hypothetical protein VJU58_04120 [Microbacterium sp.]|nr:hypothetical protein [Microbacterium sp.]